MDMHNGGHIVKSEVTPDDARQIHELKARGHGSNYIGHLLDINASAVKAVLHDKRVSYSEKLSTRQRQGLLNTAFRPIEERP